MFASIKHCLSNLTTFKGRDGRATFWFYVLLLVVAQYVLGFLIALPMMGGVAQDALNAAREGVSEVELQKQMLTRMSGMMRTSMLASGALALIFAFLLLAAFVRRLHDSNRPGWIAAIPFLLVLAGQAASIANMDAVLQAMSSAAANDPAATLEAQRPLLLAGALSWLGYLIVIVFGVWPSSDGNNRYGPEPDHF